MHDEIIRKIKTKQIKTDKFLFYFISKENEQKLIQCIEEKFKDSYFRSIDASFILKCIDCGFEYESINKILKINDIKVVDLLKNIPKEKYELFEHLDIKNMFINIKIFNYNYYQTYFGESFYENS